MRGIIYKITLDELEYYGSCRDFDRRMKKHRERLMRETHKHLKLYEKMKNSVNKKCETIEVIDDINDEDLRIKEHEYIDKNDTINNGLNMKRAHLTKEDDLADRRIAQNKYKEKNYEKCLECVRNISKKNRDSGKFRCDVCDHNFHSNRDLQRHLNSKRHNKNINNNNG